MTRLWQRLTALDRDLILIFLGLFFWGLGAFLYIFIQPLYLTELGASPQQIGLALGIGGVVTTLLYAPIGLWADRRGRKGVILAGWSLGTLAGYGFAFAPDWRWFIPAMAAYTLSNFAVSVLNGYVASKAQPEQRSLVYALISTGFSIGSILSPALGGWIGEQYGLRMVYLIAAMLFTCSTLIMCFISPQQPEPQATSASAWALLRDRTLLWHIVFVLLLFFAVDVGLILAPKFLAEVRGLDLTQIGSLGTVSAIGVLILAPLISKVGGSRRLAIGAGTLITLLSVILLLWLPGFVALVVAFFFGGGNRLIRAPVLARFTHLLTPATMSFGLGLQQTAIQIGLAASPYVAGVLYAQNVYWPFYAGGISLILVLGMTALLPNARPATNVLQPVQEA